MRNLSYLVDTYDHIALDTEFPGVVVRPVGKDPPTQYNALRVNVDLLKVIQLGISLSNENAESPHDVTTWQFNFKFSLAADMYAQDSIDLLIASGIDFALHERDGIDPLQFGELLTTSGLVLNPDVKWICFAGSYDFCYLFKLLTAEALPEQETKFFQILKHYFPTVYDIKYLMLSSDRLFGGLNNAAEQLGCERVGAMHQAGSDSLLTSDVFFRMKSEVFRGIIESDKEGVLYRLGKSAKNTPVFSPTKSLDGNGTDRHALVQS